MKLTPVARAIKVFGYTIGKKKLEVAASWAPSGAMYLVCGVILVPWLTEWKTVLRYVPFYNTRYTNRYYDDKVVYVDPLPMD